VKTLSILISNYNSYEAIQLCLESVQKYTSRPHQIIVYDDASTNKVDRIYLAKQEKESGIKVILGEHRLNHGGAINMLLSRCKTDLAVILDNDVEILADGWLDEVEKSVNDKTLCVCGIESNYQSGVPSLSDWMQTWFIVLNMAAYRDGMEVDWRRAQENGIMLPVGARLWLKAKNDNPKFYEFIPNLPKLTTFKFYHFAHVSCIATYDPSDTPEFIEARRQKMEEVSTALRRLRES
jgi:glycosyltransferase involved in cell wall biosynthesis